MLSGGLDLTSYFTSFVLSRHTHTHMHAPGEVVRCNRNTSLKPTLVTLQGYNLTMIIVFCFCYHVCLPHGSVLVMNTLLCWVSSGWVAIHINCLITTHGTKGTFLIVLSNQMFSVLDSSHRPNLHTCLYHYGHFICSLLPIQEISRFNACSSASSL